MGLGLMLRGRFSNDSISVDERAEQVFGRLSQMSEYWWRPPSLVEREDDRVIQCEIHPSEESVLILMSEDSEWLCITAKTSGAGPGYHEYVCELVRLLEHEFGLEWTTSDELGDETQFITHGDRSRLRDQMTRWFRNVAEVVLDSDDIGFESTLALSMPINCGFTQDGGVLTPMGTWSYDRLASAKNSDESALEFFSWVESGWSARTCRDAAIAAMWMYVRWCRPRTEEEAAAHAYVLQMLQRSHDLDPEMPQPWREWLEILDYGDDHDDPALHALISARVKKVEAQPLIGYRRNPVRHTPYPGVSIMVPGDFSEAEEDDGRVAILFSDEVYVRLSSLTLPPHREAEMPPAEGRVIREWVAEGARARLEALGEDVDDDNRLNYRCVMTVGPSLMYCSMNVPDVDFEPQVVELTDSIRLVPAVESGDQTDDQT